MDYERQGDDMSMSNKSLSKELQEIANDRLRGEQAAIAQRNHINLYSKEGKYTNQFIFKNH